VVGGDLEQWLVVSGQFFAGRLLPPRSFLSSPPAEINTAARSGEVNECNGYFSSVVPARSSWVGPHVELVLVFVGDPKSTLLVKMAGRIYLYNRKGHGF
jgi:hypothetical protein